MKKTMRAAVVVLPAVLAMACGSSSSSSSSTSASGTESSDPGPLHGTFVPAGSTAEAQFASITFRDPTHYSLTRANCTGSACGSSGTYTFDGTSDLELTDATSKVTEHVDFQATQTGGAATVPLALHLLDLVSSDAGPALVSDGGSLLQRILQALVNGILMVLDDGTDSGAGAGTGASASDGSVAPGIPPTSDVDVRGAIAELQQQLNSPPLQPYYQDGSRIQGCFANPVGNDLTDIQKSFYCSMPLEFRLCNSIVLLQNKDVDSRWQGYLQCQQRVDGMAGNQGRYLYDAKINATYYWLLLNGQSELSPADEASVVAATKPAPSGQSFQTLLGTIVTSLAGEAATSAFSGLQDLVNEAQSAASAAGNFIA